jgi:hypothetical protein
MLGHEHSVHMTAMQAQIVLVAMEDLLYNEGMEVRVPLSVEAERAITDLILKLKYRLEEE